MSQKTAKTQRGPTFRKRLSVSTALLCLSVLVLAGVGVYWQARQAMRANLDASLLSVARFTVSALKMPDTNVPVGEKTPEVLLLPSETGYEKFAQIEDSADQIIARTDNLRPNSPLPAHPDRETRARDGHVVYGDLDYRGVPLRAVYYPFRDAKNQRILAVIAISQEPNRRALDALTEALGLSLILGAGLAGLGASRLARRLTAPLTAIAGAARSVGGASLGRRIPAVSPDAELREITDVLNEMLARLEAAFAAQTRFAADASHELRSPLSNLRGTVEVALRRPRSPAEYRETLTVALAEVERLSRLVSVLMTLSRADSGQFALVLAPCDLAQIAAQAVAAHAARAAELSVTLTLGEGDPLPVFGDVDRLRQALDNLLDNALRYAPAGSTVNLTAIREGESFSLTVRDGGPGLSETDQTRIFDRFYRADESRARQSGGLGLGLAITKAIAEAHGGRVEVQSAPGTGAVFTLVLPVATKGDVYSIT